MDALKEVIPLFRRNTDAEIRHAQPRLIPDDIHHDRDRLLGLAIFQRVGDMVIPDPPQAESVTEHHDDFRRDGKRDRPLRMRQSSRLRLAAFQ
jgi:hypothetical protein